MAFIKNINDWTRKSEKAKAKIKVKAVEYVRKRVLVVYMDVLKVSPQWSGNYAYNWQVELTNQEGSYSGKFKPQDWRTLSKKPRQQGDLTGMESAIDTVKDTLRLMKWNSRIVLKNYAPIADKIEAGTAGNPTHYPNTRGMRPVNLVAASTGIVAYIKQKYRYV